MHGNGDMHSNGSAKLLVSEFLYKARVQLFVNSKDAEHLNKVVSKAISLHRAGRLQLLAVYHIGDYRTLAPDRAKDLEELQVPYEAAAQVPYGNACTLSPTWAFMSFEGIRLVEGYLSPERFLDTQGGEPPAPKLDAMEQRAGELAGW
jgi:hypothetical protein